MENSVPITPILKRMHEWGMMRMRLNEFGGIVMENDCGRQDLSKQDYNDFVSELVGFGISVGCYTITAAIGDDRKINLSMVAK